MSRVRLDLARPGDQRIARLIDPLTLQTHDQGNAALIATLTTAVSLQ
jgi:hypothetical protein